MAGQCFFLRRSFLILFAAALAWAVACQSQTQPPDAASSTPQENAFVFIKGAGATLPGPLYQRWFAQYNRQHPNIQVNYQPIGSGAGIQQVIAETVDFGASDVAMTDEEISQVGRGVVLLPMTAGSVAVVYNLPGIGSGLKLSRQVVSEIFLGKITRWRDPKIAALNPNLTLPDLPITVIHRSDGSGTTAVFTAHLSAISREWQESVGTSLSVDWPAGVGVKSNAGVSAQVQQEPGTIGYVEYSFAQQLGLSTAALENRSGEYVLPSIEAAAKALESVQLPDNLRGFVRDPQAVDAYPIVTYSWLLAYKRYEDPQKAKALKEVIRWGLTTGQGLAPELGYVPLATEVAQKVAAAAAEISP